ncbi:MAG: hypothetical protein ABR582_14720 [Gemmatimonadaceae bacterium]
MPSDDYLREVQREIDDANAAAQDTFEVTFRLSRQTYRDLVKAYKFLRSINPLWKSIAQRLERFALDVRDALDRSNAP